MEQLVSLRRCGLLRAWAVDLFSASEAERAALSQRGLSSTGDRVFAVVEIAIAEWAPPIDQGRSSMRPLRAVDRRTLEVSLFEDPQLEALLLDEGDEVFKRYVECAEMLRVVLLHQDSTLEPGAGWAEPDAPRPSGGGLCLEAVERRVGLLRRWVSELHRAGEDRGVIHRWAFAGSDSAALATAEVAECLWAPAAERLASGQTPAGSAGLAFSLMRPIFERQEVAEVVAREDGLVPFRRYLESLEMLRLAMLRHPSFSARGQG